MLETTNLLKGLYIKTLILLRFIGLLEKNTLTSKLQETVYGCVFKIELKGLKWASLTTPLSPQNI